MAYTSKTACKHLKVANKMSKKNAGEYTKGSNSGRDALQIVRAKK